MNEPSVHLFSLPCQSVGISPACVPPLHLSSRLARNRRSPRHVADFSSLLRENFLGQVVPVAVEAEAELDHDGLRALLSEVKGALHDAKVGPTLSLLICASFLRSLFHHIT